MSPGPAWPDCLSKMLAHLPTATGMALRAAGCNALGLRAPMLLRNQGGVALTPTAPGPRGPSASLPPPSTQPLLTLAREPQESPGYLLGLVSAGLGLNLVVPLPVLLPQFPSWGTHLGVLVVPHHLGFRFMSSPGRGPHDCPLPTPTLLISLFLTCTLAGPRTSLSTWGRHFPVLISPAPGTGQPREGAQ